ncbi:MAG: glutaredoxin family protein [Pseudomonadota bacterium]
MFKKGGILRQGLFFTALLVLFMRGPDLIDRLRGAPQYDASVAGPVTVFTTAWCGYCKKTKHFLKTHGIPFIERDIEASDEAMTTFVQLGGQGVPLVVVGEQIVSGYSLGRLRAALECRGCDG